MGSLQIWLFRKKNACFIGMTPGQICRDPISSKDFDKNMFNNGNNYRRRHGEKDFYTALFTRFRMKTKKNNTGNNYF